MYNHVVLAVCDWFTAGVYLKLEPGRQAHRDLKDLMMPTHAEMQLTWNTVDTVK